MLLIWNIILIKYWPLIYIFLITYFLKYILVQTKKESSYQPDILPSVTKTKGEWKSGDRCLAQLADDGKFYEGTIETIDGEAVAVLIDGQKAAAVTTLDYIKDLPRTHPNEMKHK